MSMGGSRTISVMDAKTARTLNIRILVSQAGGPTDWANTYSPPDEAGKQRWAPAQVSQWISDDKPKPIGHKLARDLERAMQLSGGALDRSPESQPVQFDRDMLATTLEIVAAQGLSPQERADSGLLAELIIKTYARLHEARHMGSVPSLLLGVGRGADGGRTSGGE